MKRIIAVLVVLSVPLLLFGTVRQAGGCREIRAELARLVEAQRELVELNRKLSVGISVLGARSRIEAAAEGTLGLGHVAPGRTIRVEIGTGRGKKDG
ncbi:MAG: cell division protein FtsL [Spirochaetes bacterium]|nr:cell division protein FtsL [Spirochaetota bacterium]